MILRSLATRAHMLSARLGLAEAAPPEAATKHRSPDEAARTLLAAFVAKDEAGWKAIAQAAQPDPFVVANALLGRLRAGHLACHGHMDAALPWLSGLALTGGEALTLDRG